MKIRAFLLSLLLILAVALPGFAADITVAQSGNWSVPATWSGGALPGTGDTVVINAEYILTVDGDYTVAGLNIYGRGTVLIDTDRTLTCTGGSAWGGTSSRLGKLTFRAGSELVIGGTFQIGALVMRTENTTAANPARLSGAGNISHTATYRSDINVSHMVFDNDSTISLAMGSNSASILTEGEAGITFTDCIFLSGGKVTAASTNTGITTPRIEVVNCDFRDRDLDVAGVNFTTKRVVHSTFSSTAGGNQFRMLGSSGGNCTGNIFDNYFVSAASSTTFVAEENLFIQTLGEDGDNIMSQGSAEGTIGAYVRRNYAYSSVENSHGFGGGAYNATNYCLENVFELSPTIPGGPNMFTFGTGPQIVSQNLVMGKAVNLCGMAGNLSGQGIEVTRNTITGYTTGSTGDPMILLTELGTGDNYGGTEVIHSNLVAPSVATTASSAGALVGGSGAPDDVFTTIGYNAHYNMSGTKYVYGTLENDYSANDVALAASPGFVDSSRSIASWASSEQGLTESLAAAVAAFLRINGFNPATGIRDAAVFTADVADLLDWVRAGFVPTNEDLAGAGYLGVDIGAMDVGEGSGEPDPDPETNPTKTVSVTLYSDSTPRASLTGITALWWDVVPPTGCPVFSTNAATTNANGTLTLNLTDYTALEGNQTGFLLLYQHNATDYRKSNVFGSRLTVEEE